MSYLDDLPLETKLCQAVGPLDASIAFIGEAPGAEEEKKGVPFVGRAGWLFDELLKSAGLVRSQCYIDNVILERPPNNDVSKFIKFNTKGEATVTDAYRGYEQKLHDRLKKVGANVLVPLGNVPLYALTRLHGITKRRGSILWSHLLEKKVIPCIHPSAALRQYLYRRYIIMDLRSIAKESEYPEMNLPERTYHLKPGFDEAMSYLERALSSQVIAFDIEVVRSEVSCISIALSATDCMSIAFVEKGQDLFDPEQEAHLWQAIAQVLENNKIKKIGQNLTFDVTFLFNRYGIRTENIEDTMVAHGVLFPDFPKGLDFLTSEYTREPYYKDEGKQYLKIGGNDQDFWLYNAKDSALCHEIFKGEQKDLEQLGNLETYTAQKSLILPLSYMSSRGIRMNLEGLRAEGEQVGREVEQLTEEFDSLTHKHGARDVNPNSPKQLKDYFYITRGANPYKNRTTGSITVDEDALKRLSRKGYKEATTLIEIRHKTKLKGTYLDVALDEDNRLRCSYNPVGTKSGRLSSSKTIFGTGTNMQNQPSSMKRHMLADEGYLIFEVDLSQAENRIVSYIAPEPTMIKAFEKGIDVHSMTGSFIFGIPIENVIEMNKQDIKCELGNGDRTHRYWGKTANHALNYDMGYKRFAFMCEIQERDARAIVDKYHMLYPGVRKFHRWVRYNIDKSRTLENPFGRQRLFLDRKDDTLYKEAYNWMAQSTVADIINRWGLIPMYYEPHFRELELLNQVHDSIVFQVPTGIGFDRMATLLKNVKNSLERTIDWMGAEFKIPAEFKAGHSLSPMTELILDHTLPKQLRSIYEGR